MICPPIVEFVLCCECYQWCNIVEGESRNSAIDGKTICHYLNLFISFYFNHILSFLKTFGQCKKLYWSWYNALRLSIDTPGETQRSPEISNPQCPEAWPCVWCANNSSRRQNQLSAHEDEWSMRETPGKCDESYWKLPLSVTPSHQHRVDTLEKEAQKSCSTPSIIQKHLTCTLENKMFQHL